MKKHEIHNRVRIIELFEQSPMIFLLEHIDIHFLLLYNWFFSFFVLILVLSIYIQYLRITIRIRKQLEQLFKVVYLHSNNDYFFHVVHLHTKNIMFLTIMVRITGFSKSAEHLFHETIKVNQ